MNIAVSFSLRFHFRIFVYDLKRLQTALRLFTETNVNAFSRTENIK